MGIVDRPASGELSRGESTADLEQALAWLEQAQTRFALDSTEQTIGQLRDRLRSAEHDAKRQQGERQSAE
ncbi:MAG: hypothetical protein KDA44_06795 [Planctomycetales bacterium]|nr:hypothetical protein [Planctomycetales bacterium]